MKTFYTTLAFLLIITSTLLAQNATVKGITLDELNNVIGGVNISYGETGTQSDINGYYLLEIPANENVKLTFSYIGLKDIVLNVTLSAHEDYEFNPVLRTDVAQIGTVIISVKERKRVEGIISISPEAVRKLPGANAGVENLLKSL
ncbi:MAG: hypothetical protein ACI917_001081, partial [Patiriisocius sp.]